MNRLIIIVLSFAMLASCKNKEYLEHKLEFEKIAEDCDGKVISIHMNSNINGDRFEFNKCLPESFTDEKLTMTRQGDTIIVQFPKPMNNDKQSEYHIILDIDTYPRYNFLMIDGETFPVVPASASKQIKIYGKNNKFI